MKVIANFWVRLMLKWVIPLNILQVTLFLYHFSCLKGEEGKEIKVFFLENIQEKVLFIEEAKIFEIHTSSLLYHYYQW